MRAAAPLPREGSPPHARGRPLDGAACRALVREVGWGVLSVVERRGGEAAPAAVPAAYACDGERIYLALAPGRPLRALEENPRLALTVADVAAPDRWRAVTVTGRARWLPAREERAAAVAAFANQRRPSGRRLTSDDLARLLASRLAALEPEAVLGYESSGAPEPRPAPPAAEPEFPCQGAADLLPPDDDALATGAMDALRRIVRALRTADGDADRRHGLGAAQLYVLRQLADVPALGVGELARRTLTSRSAVSEVAARLAARGFVARGSDAADRRRAVIALTDAGRAVLARAPETVQERLVAGFRRLPAARRESLARGLAEWMRECGLSDVEATMFFEPLGEGGSEG